MYFAACEKGKHGFYCEKRCLFPYYGTDCQSRCQCAETYCHYADGCGQTSKIGILIKLLFMSCIYHITNLMFLNVIIAIKIFLHRENSNVFSDTLHQYVT